MEPADAIYRRHAPELLKFAITLVRTQEAQDVVHDAMLSLQRSPGWEAVVQRTRPFKNSRSCCHPRGALGRLRGAMSFGEGSVVECTDTAIDIGHAQLAPSGPEWRDVGNHPGPGWRPGGLGEAGRRLDIGAVPAGRDRYDSAFS
jgi:hypothetical protein